MDSVASAQGELTASGNALSFGTDSTTMKNDTDPVTPETPEQKPAASQHTPRSSRVTINVRFAPSRPLETIPASPSPIAETGSMLGSSAIMVLDDDVKISVEETEVDMTNADTPDPRPASSGSETSSPPVEIIAIDDDQDDDLEYENAQPSVTLLHGPHDNILGDPTDDFPFHDANESFPDTVKRLCAFMTTRMSSPSSNNRYRSLTQVSSHEDESVAREVSAWIQNYLAFAKVTEHYMVWESYRANRELWHILPELINSMITRR